MPNSAKRGFGGFRCPEVKAESRDIWSEDYAIFFKLYLDTHRMDGEEYFNHEQLKYDFEQFIRKYYADDPSVELAFYACQEVEVFRRGLDGKVKTGGTD